MNTLNFNKYRPPIMVVEMPDEENTVLHIMPPTVNLQEELRATVGELTALLDGGKPEQRAAFYDLAARLMSNNRDWLEITSEDLRKKYHLDVEDLTVFFHNYAEFVTGIEHAKN